MSITKANQNNALDEAVLYLMEETKELLHMDYETIRSERFTKEIFCPHCLNNTGKVVKKHIKYGLVNGTKWQRYRCMECEKIFSDMTRTFFHRSRSRNVAKWPLFIQLVYIDKLPFKQIATKLELHINTIYSWNKKLSAFFDQFLPNRQFHPSDQTTYDYTTIFINSTNKGRSPADNNQANYHKNIETGTPSLIPVTIAVNRENPAHTLLTIGNNGSNLQNPTDSKPLTAAIENFRAYYSDKHGVSARRLQVHLNTFRMMMLMKAINPDILASELFKLCLDKENLYRSNRLIKKLI